MTSLSRAGGSSDLPELSHFKLIPCSVPSQLYCPVALHLACASGAALLPSPYLGHERAFVHPSPDLVGCLVLLASKAGVAGLHALPIMIPVLISYLVMMTCHNARLMPSVGGLQAQLLFSIGRSHALHAVQAAAAC